MFEVPDIFGNEIVKWHFDAETDTDEEGWLVDLVEEAQFEAFAKLLTFETLGKMAYLQAALSETLRLFPAVPLVLVSILLSFLWYQVVSFHMSFAST